MTSTRSKFRRCSCRTSFLSPPKVDCSATAPFACLLICGDHGATIRTRTKASFTTLEPAWRACFGPTSCCTSCKTSHYVPQTTSTDASRDARSAFFSAFHTLAVDAGGGGTGFASRLLATLLVKRVVDAIQGAVVPSWTEVPIPLARADRYRASREGNFKI